MLSWRKDVVEWTRAGKFLILLPVDDTVIIPGASSETAFDQQMMKLEQRRHRYTRRPNGCHVGARDGVQHPRGDRRDHARHCLDVNNLAGNTLFAIVPPHTAPMERCHW